MIRLVITSGGDKGRTYEVAADGETVVGRVSECGVHIADGRISRRHCVISAGQAGYAVKDLKSSNGTFVNGARVTEAALKDGDKLKVGVIEMEFRIAERIEDGKTELLGTAGRPSPERAVTQAASAPLEVVVLEPAKPAVPAPAEPVAPAPVEPAEPAPVAAVAPVPVEREKPATAAEPVPPAAVKAPEPVPAESGGPAPVQAVEPAPVEVVEPAPVEAAKPVPAEPIPPAPVEVVESAPVEVVEPAPVEVAKPVPAEPVPPAPVEVVEPTPAPAAAQAASAGQPAAVGAAGQPAAPPDRPPGFFGNLASRLGRIFARKPTDQKGS